LPLEGRLAFVKIYAAGICWTFEVDTPLIRLGKLQRLYVDRKIHFPPVDLAGAEDQNPTLTTQQLVELIKNAGRHPIERDTLMEKRSVFIELKIGGKPQSLMGRLRIENPLYQAASDIALLTAFEDPRVEPFTIDKIDNFELEISVLSKLKLERNIDRLKIGINGVMIKLDMNSAITLPQEALRQNWTVTEMLEETCLKAGMGKNSYKDKFAEIFSFTAEVF